MALGTTATRPSSRRKILVVEDSVLNREMLRTLLEEEYTVIEARDGLEGLELLGQHFSELSLILLDVYMPRCDGFEFLRRKSADARYDAVPVIVTTAGGSIEDELACLKLGANDFVIKPYNFDIIKNRVGNMVRLRESAAIVNRLTWDETTNLYTREFFYHAVESAFEAQPDAAFDLICTDVSNFGTLESRYGESKCNLMLKQLSSAVCERLPELVAAGRIGNDQLAFLADHREGGWKEALGAPLAVEAIPNINVKVGIVERVDHGMDVSQICSRALSAIATIRGRYDINIAVFDDKLHEHLIMEQTIRESMEEALRELQFSVFYQPKHDVRTGRVGGAEALVRWFHPTIGFVSPGLFIPIFERNGFITALDLFVWEEACKEIARIKELGLPSVPISVNASRLDFDVPDLPQQIAALADRHGVDHSLLHVELTESAYSDNPEMVTAMLRQLTDLGFSTELDDFGSGYSSLVSLNTLPLDVMKLDMSMVRQATELNDFRIVESTIKLAQVLGLQTVVEGVETAEEAQKVTEMGCDLIQGYYYAKPLRREEFEDYLRASM